MPRSVTSVFSEAEDFEAALREVGCRGFLVTGRGEFQARLTRVTLHRLRLSAAEERLPRITFVVVPPDMILVSLASGNGPEPVRGGIGMGTNEIMTLGPGQSILVRSEGPCRWSSIWLPIQDLVRFGGALSGETFAVPSAAQWWRPRQATTRHLRYLHSAAIGREPRDFSCLLPGPRFRGCQEIGPNTKLSFRDGP